MSTLDGVLLAVMANRLDSITREMTNTMIRTARSTTMASRDFSCSLVTSECDLVSCPEGIPVHVFGSTLIAEALAELQPNFAEGDAFLHNDPYQGNSHAADQTVVVPVFFEGEHVFTSCAKAHQADIGASLPTTYMPTALDVYNEGALIFPMVQIQRHYADVPDILRMCERRIRNYPTWYGDYLAAMGAARLAERRLKEFCETFGIATVRTFIREWLDYCEEMAAAAIRKLPAGRFSAETSLDPFPGVPDGIPLRAEIEVDPVAGRIMVDLTDNPDCTPTGLNLTESTSRNSGTTAVLMVLNSKADADEVLVPNNSGSYRRIEVRLRENCVVGIPRHPASCSVATNTVADRVVAMITAAFAERAEGIGASEPCFGSPPFEGVVSGYDPREGKERPYVFQLFSGTSGGPGTTESDGWLAFINTAGAGLAYIDSTEVVEQKYPMLVWEKFVRPDSEGAGRRRGAPGNIAVYGPLCAEMWSHYFLDGVVNPPKGVRGGGRALGPEAWRIDGEGSWTQVHGAVGEVRLDVGEAIVSVSAGGGGYGEPCERPPADVLEDVREGYVSAARARVVYGVVLEGDVQRWETLEIDEAATEALRRALRQNDARQETRAMLERTRWWIEDAVSGWRPSVSGPGESRSSAKKDRV